MQMHASKTYVGQQKGNSGWLGTLARCKMGQPDPIPCMHAGCYVPKHRKVYHQNSLPWKPTLVQPVTNTIYSPHMPKATALH